MGSVNLRALTKEVAAQAQKPLEKRAEKIFNNALERQIDLTIQDLDSNPITEEIEGGPSAPGSLANGGNLFAFLGFNSNEKPISVLRNFLKRNIKYRGTIKYFVRGNRVRLERTIESPSLSEIYNNNQSPGVNSWTNKSWLQMIEDGIPNFANFIFGPFKSPPSRSTTGLQIKNEIRGRGGFPGIRYISQIMANLRKRIR